MREVFYKKGSKEYWASLYKSYTKQREIAESKNYLLRRKLSFGAFKEAYKILQEKGVTQNIVRTQIREETLISYTKAKGLIRYRAYKAALMLYKDEDVAQQISSEVKLTREKIIENLNPAGVRKYIGQAFSEFGQRISEKGMTTTQAYFAYMSELGQREEAEAEYGY